MDRLHQSKMLELLQKRGADGRPMPHTLLYCKKGTGELATYRGARLTSYHAKGDTVNVKMEDDPQPKKLRRCLILQIDGIKIYF